MVAPAIRTARTCVTTRRAFDKGITFTLARTWWPGSRHLDFDPHWFRHSAATRWLRDGVSVEVVSKLLGHSSVTTTSAIYGKPRELHQPGEELQVSSSQDRRNAVPLVLMPALCYA